jgi:hypothetical protein
MSRLPSSLPTSKPIGPDERELGVDDPGVLSVTMIEPVCRSPWSSASARDRNFSFSAETARLSAASPRTPAASASSCGLVQRLRSQSM